MKVIIINEEYLEERFKAFINQVKLNITEMGHLKKTDADTIRHLFNYYAHKLKEELVKGPDR